MARYERCPGTEFDPEDGGRCTTCGQKYHCAKCGAGCGMMAHWAGDNKPFHCEVYWAEQEQDMSEEKEYYEGIESLNDYADYFRHSDMESGKAAWAAILAHEKEIGAWQ